MSGGGPHRADQALGSSVLATFLTLGMLFGTVMQFAIGVLAPVLIAELGVTETDIAVITTVLYVTSVLASARVGGLADRFGGRSTLLGLFVMAALGLFALGSASGLLVMAIAAAFAGVASGASNPVTNSLLVEHLAGRTLALVMGIKQSGVKLAQLVVGAVLPPAVLYFGWRLALFIAGAIGLVVLVLAALMLRAPETPRSAERERTENDRPPVARGVPLEINLLALYSLLLAIAVSSFDTFFTVYAVRELEIPLAAAAGAVGVVGFVGIFARILWAMMGERLPSVTPVLCYLAAGSTVALVAVARVGTGDVAMLWIAAFLFGLTGGTWTAIVQLAVVRVPSVWIGRNSGRVQAGFTMGLALGPMTFSTLLNQLGSYRSAWLVVAIPTGCGALLALAIWRYERLSSRRSRPQG